MAERAPSEPDVFLSYAREDEARARELAEALERRGLSVFWDREVPGGQTWHSHIGEALANARCVVVAWSRHSIASQWVLEEANEGRDRKVLMPVLLEAVQPPFGFRAIQAANLVDWRPGQPSSAFDNLLSAVQRILGGQGGRGADPEPEPPPRPQPTPSEPAPKTKPSVRRAIPLIVGLVVLAGAGSMVWWLTKPGPTDPEARQWREPTVFASRSPPLPSKQTSGAATESGEAREGMRDCPECPEMVLVPAGQLAMGSLPDEPGRDDDEGPLRTVTIPESFWVSKYEVTFAEWDACVAAAECSNEKGDDNRPVLVSWNDAKAYVFWLSQKTGKTYRLLSEAEWEYAARAGSTTAFWWGQGVGSDNANCNGCGGGWGGRTTAPVGRFQGNNFGLYDTVGNVWEWVEDCYHDNYEGAPTDGAPRLDGECTHRVLRGGAWNDEPKIVRSASRDRNTPDTDWENDIGFRVKRAAD